MATDDGNETFAKDLGYLDKFFDKIEAHAGSLSDDAGARLRMLMSEERDRWSEIRALCAGDAPRGCRRQPGRSAHHSPGSGRR